ncbi:MAG: adenylate/guanylate cyclase domain-containing protein [Proteobacteria bacterium]|nr:adenylate/guanylate cyclase domain-containing protein [Pseudomonadota bacterium]MBU1687661.1 adenylate/guanylate cyclase domain-containing protein [Pseudomonadota bacterium]
MILQQLKKKNLLWELLIVLAVTGLISGLYQSGFFQRLEWMTLDQRMKVYRSTKKVTPEIVTVMIDEASLQDMNSELGRWPWPRSVYGDLLEFMVMGGAKAVLFDILLTQNESHTERGIIAPNASDQYLIDQTSETGVAYHSAQIIIDREDEAKGRGLDLPLPDDFREKFAVRPASGFRRHIHNNYFLPFQGLSQASKGIGIVGLDADPDGVIRRVRLFREYQGELFPSMAVVPLLDDLLTEKGVVYTPGNLALGDKSIPLDLAEDYLVNPYGMVQEYSVSGIFHSLKMIKTGEVENLLIYPDEFAGKIVYIGANAAGLEDIKTTPMSAKIPGVMVHVWAASNILQNDFLKKADPALTHWLILIFSLVSALAIFHGRHFMIRSGFPFFVLGGYLYFGFSAYAGNRVYDLVAPTASVLLTLLGSFTYLSFTEGRDKKKVRQVFSRYVSPEILTELLDKSELYSMGEVGRQEDMTILFSDLRGFTSMSEILDAAQIVDLLNCHFGAMTEVVFEHQGTLDKFIGDAMMAFWGAPLRVENHADHAVMAALAMVEKLDEVNAELKRRKYPEIKIGIGLNSGKVILGNIGSERKMDYTVIGDNVNLASRLEGVTKQYGYPVIISEYTWQKLVTDIPCMVVDQIRVKGKKKPIKIYAPLASPDGPDAQLAAAREKVAVGEEAFRLYQARQWDLCMDLYRSLDNTLLGEIYRERCAFFKQSPPPPEWDGVFTMTTK